MERKEVLEQFLFRVENEGLLYAVTEFGDWMEFEKTDSDLHINLVSLSLLYDNINEQLEALKKEVGVGIGT